MILFQCMKGIKEFRNKLPDYSDKKIRLYVVMAFIIFVISLLFQLFFDSLPRIFRETPVLQLIAPVTPVIGSLIIISIGFLVIRKFWRIRDKYLSKYGDKAYQKAFKLVVIGIPMLFSVIIHSFFSTDLIIPYGIDDTLSFYLGTSISKLIFGFPFYILYIRLVLSIVLIGLGLIVVNRALKFFGIDYMSLIYIFFPEESKLQNHEIYSILRHPTYHSLILISIGAIFFRFSIYSVIYFLIFLVGINIHIKYVEEKELIQRFGDDYKKYRKTVPAFFVKLKDLKKYFSTLFHS